MISLHKKDENILENIVDYFGVGKVYKPKEYTVQLQIDSFKDLEVILNHFDKYPLLTKKFEDYKLFS